MTKRFANEKYRLACTQPYLWMCKAQEVRRAADILWDQFVREITAFTKGEDTGEPFFGQVALMLYGLALENMLKAGLASMGVAAHPNGNFSQKSHDLMALSKEFNVEWNLNEAELLFRLQEFIEWAGRYPIPLSKEGLYPREFSDGSCGGHLGVSTGDATRVIALLERVQSLLPSEDEAAETYAKSYRV